MEDVNLTKKVFSTNLTRIRLSRNLSIEDFADLVELSISEIVNYEKAIRFPSSKSLDKILRNLEIQITELFLTPEDIIITPEQIQQVHELLETYVKLTHT